MILGMEEIGSNYWMSTEQLECCSYADYDAFVKKYPDYFFASSGRGAMKLLLASLSSGAHSVLLPNYTCDSVAKPFSDLNYKVHFYKVRSDLEIDIDEVNELIAQHKPSCILFQSYFGFDTLKTIRPHYGSIRAKECMVIEDVTHCMFSSFPRENADFYVCSLRKWLEIPDGAFVSSPSRDINLYARYEEHREIVDAFIQASRLKVKYMETGDVVLKDAYRHILRGVNEVLNKGKDDVYKISKEAVSILVNADVAGLINSRRQNFNYLLDHLGIAGKMKFVFQELPRTVVPLFFPVFIKNGQRDRFQRYMAENRIYCPVHWGFFPPASEMVNEEDLLYQEEILSIPCDQRYSLQEMARLVVVVNNFEW